jgi:hypothetical protein
MEIADRVVFHGSDSSPGFAALVFEQYRDGTPLIFDEFLVLNALHSGRRITTPEAGHLIQGE